MNCLESEEWLHQYLDGEPLRLAHVELDRHLAECDRCRELHTLAHRLNVGLRQSSPPKPLIGLAERITTNLLAQHRRARRVRIVIRFAAPLAASLLVAVLYCLVRMPARLDRPRDAVSSASARNTSQESQTEVHRDSAAETSGKLSLQRKLEEAGEAVAALTRRAADETLDQGRTFLPVILPDPAGREVSLPLPKMSPAAEPFQDMTEGITGGLEPVTASARRAVDLFLHEIPPIGSERKQGL